MVDCLSVSISRRRDISLDAVRARWFRCSSFSRLRDVSLAVVCARDVLSDLIFSLRDNSVDAACSRTTWSDGACAGTGVPGRPEVGSCGGRLANSSPAPWSDFRCCAIFLLPGFLRACPSLLVPWPASLFVALEECISETNSGSQLR